MTSNIVNGVTTALSTEPFGKFVFPDVTKAHVYFNDFNTYTAGDWTVTKTGAGGTSALADGDGGWLLSTNDSADNDAIFYQLVKEGFKFEAKKELWFDILFKVSDATQSDVVAGLQITDTTPLSVTDGVYFIKADGSTTVSLVVVKDSAATTTTVTTLASNTFTRLSYYYNGVDKITAFVNGVATVSSVTTNLPDDEIMTVSFGCQNGEAVAKTMTVDSIVSAKVR